MVDATTSVPEVAPGDGTRATRWTCNARIGGWPSTTERVAARERPAATTAALASRVRLPSGSPKSAVPMMPSRRTGGTPWPWAPVLVSRSWWPDTHPAATSGGAGTSPIAWWAIPAAPDVPRSVSVVAFAGRPGAAHPRSRRASPMRHFDAGGGAVAPGGGRRREEASPV